MPFVLGGSGQSSGSTSKVRDLDLMLAASDRSRFEIAMGAW